MCLLRLRAPIYEHNQEENMNEFAAGFEIRSKRMRVCLFLYASLSLYLSLSLCH